jgi:hypothetical protein
MIFIYCNNCFTEIKSNPVQINHTFGYGSKRDGESVEIHLCENCFEKIFLEKKLNLKLLEKKLKKQLQKDFGVEN